ncbi:MAG: flavodoxin [Acetatifactor sp.]
MKRMISFLLPIVTVLTLVACGEPAGSDKQEETPDPVTGVSEHTVEQSIPLPERSANVSTEEQETDRGTKTLVVYFSCTGTTKKTAEYAAEILEADIYEIHPQDPYTETDLAYYTGGRADQEQDDPDARPAISESVEDMDSYSTVLIGYPIWHGQAPRIISTFLESYDFSEKIIIPFCTSHSSGIGSSANDLHELCADSTQWLEGRRFGTETSRDMVEEWVGSLELAER